MMVLEIENIISSTAFIVQLCSASILLFGFVKVFLRYWEIEIRSLANGSKDVLAKFRPLKLDIGAYILLGLDFYIIADILESMVAHDQTSLIRLGLVILIRTVIGYFLGKEVEKDYSEHHKTT